MNDFLCKNGVFAKNMKSQLLFVFVVLLILLFQNCSNQKSKETVSAIDHKISNSFLIQDSLINEIDSVKRIVYTGYIKKNNDSILNKKFYPSGELNFIIYSKDSIILDSREKCTKLYIEYYKNGFIKEKGCQGIFDAKETPVGTRYEYDSLQRLIKTTYFHPDKFGKDYKIVKDYNELGEIISDKIFRNDELYEIDMIELKKIPK